LQLGQNGDFLDDVFDFVFGALDVDDFDGDGLAGASLDSAGKSTSQY
jgi:hypothetical protein